MSEMRLTVLLEVTVHTTSDAKQIVDQIVNVVDGIDGGMTLDVDRRDWRRHPDRKFLATVNMPGYLPDSDGEIPEFDTAQEAWAHLAEAATDVHEEDPEQEGLPNGIIQMQAYANGEVDASEVNLGLYGVGSIQVGGLIYSVSRTQD